MSEKVDGFSTGYIPGIGTVRVCLDCGVVVAGGPVRCIRCAKEGPPRLSRVSGVKLWFIHRWFKLTKPKTWKNVRWIRDEEASDE